MADLGRPAELKLPRRRVLVGATLAVAIPVIAVVAVRYAGSPPALDLSTTRVTAATPVDVPVYLGVYTAPADFSRTLHLAGVKVHATASVPVAITPLLCLNGSVGATSSPQAYCSDLVDPEHHSFSAGDSIVLEVSGREPGAVSIDHVRLAYRDGIRWGTQSAGAPSVVSLLAR